ncbi:PREDICTED: uncharacterized protein LOC100632739 [Amphimedon queenslandica]|uniref:Uncharacterized protein n=1 Tax=Amphimedon queenslandica TaxID=400682 RepID=A0A1X7VFE5_AMPQE|nr:PREDICTED: uncharacterized protein LOC100632739 [Amphimedon queenslandica]|eukprot:XP_003384497.1 PREDICTED: uncharacterized protein LOC100632739 [Amphimedon queenslandica]
MNLEETVAAFGDDEIDLGGTIEYSLMIARQHGLASTLSSPFQSTFASSPQGVLKEEDIPLPLKSPSLQLILLLKEITQLRESIDQTDYKLTQLLLDKESSDLLHIDSLDSKQKQLDVLTDYFSAVVQKTSKLVTQLQKVSADSSLKVEACHHDDVVTSLSLLVNIVNKLPENIKKLNAIKQFKLKDNPDAVSPLSESAELLVECKINTQRLQNHLNLRLKKQEQ